MFVARMIFFLLVFVGVVYAARRLVMALDVYATEEKREQNEQELENYVVDKALRNSVVGDEDIAED